jgi:hypothetical protein
MTGYRHIISTYLIDALTTNNICHQSEKKSESVKVWNLLTKSL